MTEKQAIKQSEARILVYLSVVHNTRKHVTAIANKLESDYSYVMRILQAMVAKGWLYKHQYKRHMFYNLTDKAPVAQALVMYDNIALQQRLKGTEQIEEIGTYYKEERTKEAENDEENTNNSDN